MLVRNQDRKHRQLAATNKTLCDASRRAGNLHAPFEVTGNGNQLTVRLVRHSQRKRRATDRSNLQSMAPFLEPTNFRC
jgi:hypothetical protein